MSKVETILVLTLDPTTSDFGLRTYVLVTLHLPFLIMYRRPRFLEVLHAIREEMSREADYDIELFAEMVRSGMRPAHGPQRNIRGYQSRAPGADETSEHQSAAQPRKRVS